MVTISYSNDEISKNGLDSNSLSSTAKCVFPQYVIYLSILYKQLHGNSFTLALIVNVMSKHLLLVHIYDQGVYWDLMLFFKFDLF